MEQSYLYDGSFAGFLSCVFAAYEEKKTPAAICGSGESLPFLFEYRYIATDENKARRVYGALKKCSPRGARLVSRGFLCALEEKELLLLQLIRRLLAEGPSLLRDMADPDLFPVLQAVRHLERECEALRGFVRFSEISGVLAGEIEPKNRVLPILRHHFCTRFPDERIFLYDRTHKEALVYADGQHRFVPLDQFSMAAPDNREAEFRLLWKQFYDTIAIKERYNPRCRQTHMPKRYWGTMTEFQPESYFTAAPAADAASKAPAFPDGTPAPGIPPAPGPSGPGSDL